MQEATGAAGAVGSLVQVQKKTLAGVKIIHNHAGLDHFRRWFTVVVFIES